MGRENNAGVYLICNSNNSFVNLNTLVKSTSLKCTLPQNFLSMPKNNATPIWAN